MQREDEEKAEASDDESGDVDDPFILEGLSSSSEPDGGSGGLAGIPLMGRMAEGRLKAAKACREKLKQCSFWAKAKHVE